MNLCTPEYNGKDRRNGSKLKLSIMDYLKITMIILPLFAGGVVAYMNIGINSNALAENGVKIQEVKREDNRQNQTIAVIQKSIEDIKEDVGEIRIDQKINTKLLNQILGKLETG